MQKPCNIYPSGLKQGDPSPTLVFTSNPPFFLMKAIYRHSSLFSFFFWFFWVFAKLCKFL